MTGEEIFTRSGMVRPAVLVDGTVTGWWNLKDRKLKVTLFADVDRDRLTDAARALWPELKRVAYPE